jgi:hydrogenase maturation protease
VKRILVAGIGNIFFGDDAFGCEVVKELAQRPLPPEVRVADFGIRSYDLAYAVMDDYDATIFVDASPRGNEPGTVYLIEPDLGKLNESPDELFNAHGMDPVRVLQLIRSVGGKPRGLRVVGCEPAVLETEGGKIGLSEKVQAAIPSAIEMIESLITEILSKDPVQNPAVK